MLPRAQWAQGAWPEVEGGSLHLLTQCSSALSLLGLLPP